MNRLQSVVPGLRRLRELGRREGARGTWDPAGKDGHPAVRRAPRGRAGDAESDAVRMKARDFSRAAQDAEGKVAQLLRAEGLRQRRQFRNRAGFDDQHGQSAAVLPEAVPGVDQRRKAPVDGILFHIQLYVPMKAKIPSPAHQKEQQDGTRRREQQGAGAAQGGEARRRSRHEEHAGCGLQDLPRPALAGEHRGAEDGHGQLGGEAGRSGGEGEQGAGGEQQFRAQQPAQMKAPEGQLHDDQDAKVHHQIHGEEALRGHRCPPRFASCPS